MPSMTAGMYSFGIAPPTILFIDFDAFALFIRLDGDAAHDRIDRDRRIDG